MKNRTRIIVALVTFLMIGGITASAQAPKIDNERMDRDIEIAENALSTIIKQQFEKKGIWIEVKANYTPGYGVTMRLPNDNSSWIYEPYGLRGRAVIAPTPAGVNGGTPGVPSPVIIVGGSNDGKSSTSYSYSYSKDKDGKERERSNESRDSARAVYYTKIIKASKDFLADYGDLLSQLQPEEKILITNRGEGQRYYNYDYNKSNKRILVTVEAMKNDISLLRQGKMTREQMLTRIKVVNTESTNEIETDLELLSSILGRLYRSDLSKTFYTDESIYYERLKDFGVIYYMSAYSSVEMDRTPGDGSKGKVWRMPTQRLEGLSQEQKDKKIVELYPQFEKDLKENILEYAQTVKSLKDEEMFVFNVTITKCIGCGIPSTLELSVKNSIVRGLASGRIPKADAIANINVKKGPNQ